MHCSFAILFALAAATLASAAPSWKHNWEDKWAKNDFEADKVFTFDKNLNVKATPEQVRNGTTPVPGQPGAKGLFKFGINVEENTICYVGPSP